MCMIKVAPSLIMYSLNASVVALCVEDFSFYKVTQKAPSEEVPC